MTFHAASGPGEEIGPIVEQLKDKAEKLGLYMGDAMIATADSGIAEEVGITKTVKEAIEAGAEFVIISTFSIGKIAWRKRTQDPNQDEIDRQVQIMLPDPAEEIKRRLEAGGPLFGEDDDA